MIKKILTTVIVATLITSCNKSNEQKAAKVIEKTTNYIADVKYKSIDVDGVKIAYREAGDPKNKTIVLLHGFPASSHQYRKVLNNLSDEYHLIAPDYPSYGESDFPDPAVYEYTFDNISKTVEQFINKVHVDKFAIMIQDYGAPIGFRIATRNPERITAIINQNGNAYTEGLGAGWKTTKEMWANRTPETEKPLLHSFTLEGLKWQYTHGTRNPENVNPDTWNLDYLRINRPNSHKVNLDLFYDYQNNVKLYPEWQAYMRKHQPKMLIVWGKNDAFFPEPGAAAFKKDLKNIDYNIFNTGHFALEEDGAEIIDKMRTFMKNVAY